MDDRRVEEFRHRLATLKEEIIEKFVYKDQDIEKADDLMHVEFIKLYNELLPSVSHDKVLAYYLKLDLLIYNNTVNPLRINEVEKERKTHR